MQVSKNQVTKKDFSGFDFWGYFLSIRDDLIFTKER
jgi:hypothetical protein